MASDKRLLGCTFLSLAIYFKRFLKVKNRDIIYRLETQNTSLSRSKPVENQMRLRLFFRLYKYFLY